MKRIVLGVATAAVVSAAVFAGIAGGVPKEIQFTDTPAKFTPRSTAGPVDPRVAAQSGAEFAWLGPGTTDPHNVREDSRLFRSGDPDVNVDEFQLDISAGRYHYYCEVHGSAAGGMDGVVRVRPRVQTSPAGTGVIWADDAAEASHRFKVQYRRKGTTKWKTWKPATKRTSALFGPVPAGASRKYQVRARTFVKGQEERRSGWSPKVTFARGTG
jgi:plastocyanin